MWETTEVASLENLLSYNRWNKVGHDNTEVSNTFYSYYKWNWYWHEYMEKWPDVIYKSSLWDIKHNVKNWTIIITRNSDWATMEIADKNVWATEVYTYWQIDPPLNVRGNYYWWWAITPTSYWSHSSNEENWTIVQTIAPSGYHIPTLAEWQTLEQMWKDITANESTKPDFCDCFLLPRSWHYESLSNFVSSSKTNWYYWTTTQHQQYEWYYYRVWDFKYLGSRPMQAMWSGATVAGEWCSVRCFKNVTNN